MPILFALLMDVLLGEPPNRFHPTAWMGSAIGWASRFRPRDNPPVEFASGMLVTIAGVLFAGGMGYLLDRISALLPAPLNWLAIGVVLKSTFSLRGLDRAALEVQSALETNDLLEARRLVSWHLVSRDTSELDTARVAAAAIESVAENASDGIIAPLLFYALGGLPLALAYRFANTADSMLGYHDPEREWYGKFPARLDDLLNLIPARLAGMFIVLSAWIAGADGAQAWRIMWRDVRSTASPNAGVPMSAMAGALGVELEKVGHYKLGRGLRAPCASDLRRARRLLWIASGLAALSLLPVWAVLSLFNHR